MPTPKHRRAPSSHHPITWPISSFTLDHASKSPNHAYLLLDRANAEFGLFYHIAAGIGHMAQAPDDEPIYFQVSSTRAACSRPGQTCRKVCVLVRHYQLDLEFGTAECASDFLQALGRLATRVGNLEFEVFEAHSLSALNRIDFSIEKMCDINEPPLPWMVVGKTDGFDWAKAYKTGKCSDFTVVAGERSFPVHRVLLCTRSQYFNAVCDGRFSETKQKSISLPESEDTVSNMLQELYNVYNPTTGSIFTSFALRRDNEKASVMSNLVDLFVACDKYSLESTKKKVSSAIIDRLPFIHSPLAIVDIATCIYNDSFPSVDCGLRLAAISQILARLPTIMEDQEAWDAYCGNKDVLKALHEFQCVEMVQDTILTPPVSPRKSERSPRSERYRIQDRPSGG